MDKTAVKHKPTTLSSEKLVELAQNGQNIEMVMNEAMRRNSISLFAELAKLPQVVAVPSYTKWLLQIVSKAISQGHKDGAIKILKTIFNHPSVNLKAYKPNMLVNLAVSDPDIFPIIFTAQGTPDKVNTTLSARLELMDTKKANYAGEKFNHSKVTPNHNKWLASLIEYLKEGGSWNNAMSGTTVVLNRMRSNAHDQFSTELAQYSMHPHLATTMIDAAYHPDFGFGNQIIKTNLKQNESAGMKIAQFLKLDDYGAAEIIPILIGCIANEDMIPYFNMVFEKIKEKSRDQDFLEKLLTTKSLFTDVAMFNIFWNHNAETKQFLLQKIPTLSYPVLTSEEGTQWINTILTDPQGESLIKLFPKDVLTDVALPPNIRERVDKIINPSREWSDAYQVIKDMYANNNDWYKTSEAHLKMVEAGIGNQIGMGMMSAIIAVMMGSAVWNAARHHQVDQQELQNNLDNPQVVETVMESYQDFSPSAPETIQQPQVQQPVPEAQPQDRREEIRGEIDATDAMPWTGIVVHHSDSPAKTTVADIDTWHKENTYKDKQGNVKHWKGIGYNFVIYPDGSVHKGRGLAESGAHAASGKSYSRNSSHIGICLIGEEEFTKGQEQALGQLIYELSNQFDIESVERHHEECPGKSINVEQLDDTVKQMQAQKKTKSQ